LLAAVVVVRGEILRPMAAAVVELQLKLFQALLPEELLL
jgi:hypothetical protein